MTTYATLTDSPHIDLLELAYTLQHHNPADPWRHLAACAGRNTNLWFAHPGENRKAAEATAICAGCPVLYPCLAEALLDVGSTQSDIGIFGGTTPGQRAVLRRQLRVFRRRGPRRG